MTSILPIETASVFYDGIFEKPVRLSHPEGVAVDRHGNVWCGTENGNIIRIEADGSAMSSVGDTGGFIAGIAFDDKDNLFACDICHGCMFYLDTNTGELQRFGETSLNIPNYPVIDVARNALYVSDSFSFEEAGPGLWRYDLNTAEAELWYKEPISFANGMAMALDGNSLFVVESMTCRVLRIWIGEDGRVTDCTVFIENVKEFPDGVAIDVRGNVYVSCYEPSIIYRTGPEGGSSPDIFIQDPVSTLISHPTNMAFRGSTMFTTNLGRWHITRIENGVEGPQLPLKIEPGLYQNDS